ncbi:type I toxin-antitoxin system Ibs family toxin, partial [Salmonella enterica subsp. enterica serovar Brijbhumi]|nr:type I toxin-antitoxin system Ibs family toxin [Salmonella enterica subsp. enterica serovar Brijbhumi]
MMKLVIILVILLVISFQ